MTGQRKESGSLRLVRVVRTVARTAARTAHRTAHRTGPGPILD